ncbi:MAG TPA: GNAT family protein [Methylomirabilota bacterium]|nr:GNAT family protein [Methylomirabilota bacterium]
MIEGERVRLEPPRAEFLPAYRRWFSDMDVTRYMLYRHPLSDKGETDWLERTATDDKLVLWAIVARTSGRLVGNTGIHDINWRSGYAMTGIVIGEKDEWGKGYASEAMRLRTRYAFRELGLRKLITTVVGGNDASRRGLERAGYRQCGLYRRHFLVDGEWRDMWIGEILREEWEAKEGRGA